MSEPDEEARGLGAEDDAARALWEVACDELGLELDDDACERLIAFRDEVLEGNLVHNLTGLDDPLEAWNVLCLQSLVFLPRILALPATAEDMPLRLADVGSGGGIPGFPLAIAGRAVRPISLVSIESRGKKAEFQQATRDALELEDVTILAQRAEAAGRLPGLREQCDVAVVRAVGKVAEVLEYVLPLVRVGGVAMTAKSVEQVEAELPAGRTAARLLGGDPPEVEHVHLVDRVTAVVTVRKDRPTPKGYPRREGLARQAPLGTGGPPPKSRKRSRRKPGG